MFKDSLYNFFSLQIGLIEKKILLLKGAKSIDSVHSIRVGLKKIKTIITFVEELKIQGFSLKKTFKKEEQLFAILGKIRELKKQYILLLTNEKNLSLQLPEYKSYINDCLAKEQNKILNINTTQLIVHLKSVLKELLEIIEMYDDNFLYDEAILFINKEFLKITKIKNHLNDYKDWHKMRKHLKNNLYMMTIVLNSHIDSEILTEIINELDTFQDDIGNWHDEIVSFDHLASFIEKNKKMEPKKLANYYKLIQHLA